MDFRREKVSVNKLFQRLIERMLFVGIRFFIVEIKSRLLYYVYNR